MEKKTVEETVREISGSISSLIKDDAVYKGSEIKELIIALSSFFITILEGKNNA